MLNFQNLFVSLVCLDLLPGVIILLFEFTQLFKSRISADVFVHERVTLGLLDVLIKSCFLLFYAQD